MTRIFLTTTGAGTWTVPADCTSVTVECVGGGASGGKRVVTGGGGGGYSKKNSLSVTPGASVSYNVGIGGAGVNQDGIAGNNGGDTWFGSNITVLAKGGSGQSGGQSTDGYGDVKHSGGNSFAKCGGGAAGNNGDGGNAYYNSGYWYGGNGDNSYGGNGGIQSAYSGSNGGSGTEWDSTHGCGGGGGGGDNRSGGTGGNYGAGGGVSDNNNTSYYSGAGAQGLIVITYTPAVASDNALLFGANF